MNSYHHFDVLCCLAVLGLVASAVEVGASESQGSSSASYSISSWVLDGGGGRADVPDTFLFDTSFGGLGGMASSADGSVTVRSGYIGQISTEFLLMARSDTVTRLPAGTFKISVVELLANDFNAGTQPLRVTGVGPLFVGIPGAETVGETRLEEGWIFYEAPGGFSGEDRFAYVIADDAGVTAMGEVKIVVAPPDLDPTQNILSITLVSGTAHVRIRFVGIPGRTYRVEAASDLAQPDWTVIGTSAADGTGIYEFIDIEAEQFETRYYRALQP